MSEHILPHDPGQLPTRAAPSSGDSISIALSGLPPCKDMSRSIRNTDHPRYASFKALREAATQAMAGRAWYRGPVQLSLTIWAKELHPRRCLLDYIGGIMDTLDGSHGLTFTYLPIVYEDDRQVCISDSRIVPADNSSYRLKIVFLDSTKPKPPSRLVEW